MKGEEELTEGSEPFTTHKNFNEWDSERAAKRIDELSNCLSARYSFSEDKEFPHSVFDHYYLLSSYSEKRYLKILRVNEYGRTPFHLMFVHAFYTFYIGARYGSQFEPADDLQIYGSIKLKNDYGSVLIRPETLEDKIHELIDHQEVKFPDHPKFSSKYYVIAKDVEKFTSKISDEFVECMEKLHQAHFEIHGDTLLVGLKRNADEEGVLALSTFLSSIAEKKDII